MNPISKILTFVISAGLIQGCATFKQTEISNDSRSDRRVVSIEEMNTRMLASVEKSLRVLATTKNALRVSVSSQEKMKKDEWMYSVVPDGLGVEMSIEPWVGSLFSVVEMIADFAGYTVDQVGTPSANSRNVRVGGVGVPAIDHLRNVAMQAGCDAMVKPISSSRVIVVDWTYRYKSECK